MYKIFETVKLVEICSLETYTFPFNLRLNIIGNQLVQILTNSLLIFLFIEYQMIYVLLAEGNYRITVKSRMLKRKSEKNRWIAYLDSFFL